METMKQGWKMVKLGEVLKPSENWVPVVPTEKYKLLGLSLEGRGLFIREEKLGSEVSAKYLNKVVPGEFMYSRLFAWKGAFDKAAKDFEGCYVSDEFPAFKPDKGKLDIDFLTCFFKQKSVWTAVEQFCMGVTKASRNRFKEQFFMDFEIPLPSLPEQQRIAGRLAALKGKIDEVKGLRRKQEKEMKNLLLAQYRNIMEGAEWKPMREVAPLVRRPVDLQPNTIYSEVGVRSFGKGVFEKPNINSDELTWQKPYWIKAGDLLMSNIKAWEGAIAAVKKEHDGKVGSHRYLTFLPNPEITSAEFLAFHFMTDEGNLKLSEASPGSADRNRTLNTKIILNTLVPVPDMALQQDFLQLQSKTTALKAAQAGQLAALEGLFPGVLEKAFRGEW